MAAPSSLTRYGFRIRSKNGATVDKLLIMGRNSEDASRKLAQMYPACEILSAWQETPGFTGSPLTNTAPKVSFEEIADLINNKI